MDRCSPVNVQAVVRCCCRCFYTGSLQQLFCFLTASYVSHSHFFHISLSLCSDPSFLPLSFSHYFLHFLFCSHSTSPSSLLFSFPCKLLLMLSLHHGSYSHPGLVLNKSITQHLFPLLTPLLPASSSCYLKSGGV